MSDRTKARNIVQRLIDLGAIVADGSGRLVDEVYEMTHEDFIPGGGAAISASNLRAAPAGFRCGARTGEDIQSGPYYCGEAATLIGDSSGAIVCVCLRHESLLRGIRQNAEDVS